jgi:hypothetical protein
MAVRNCAVYLQRCLDSLLSQSYQDFEIIVVDDCSTDDTPRILAACTDVRLRVERLPAWAGVSRAANRGLDLAAGEFIFRMDGDDVCVPHRMARQLAYMRRNPAVGICGSALRTIDAEGRRGEAWRYPESDNDIRCHQLFFPALAQPATVVRADVVKRTGIRYRGAQRSSEDYAFWVDASRFWQQHNLRDTLLLYRRHSAQISSAQRDEQVSACAPVWERKLREIGQEPTSQQLALHAQLADASLACDSAQEPLVAAWARRLVLANGSAQVYARGLMGRVVSDHYHNYAKRLAAIDGAPSLSAYWATMRSLRGMSSQGFLLAKFAAFAIARRSSRPGRGR